MPNIEEVTVRVRVNVVAEKRARLLIWIAKLLGVRVDVDVERFKRPSG
jgi:hypothetical protein